MQNARAKCGADAASYLYLVVPKLQLKLKRCQNKKVSASTKFNVQLLRDKAFANAFQITLSNRHQVLQDMQEEDGDDISDNMESYWHNIKQIWTKACEEVVGRKKRQHKHLRIWDILHPIHKSAQQNISGA